MRLLAALLAGALSILASVAGAQVYPSPTVQTLTAIGQPTFKACTGVVQGNGTSPVTCSPNIAVTQTTGQTGYGYWNGSSAPTFSSTIPASAIVGLVSSSPGTVELTPANYAGIDPTDTSDSTAGLNAGIAAACSSGHWAHLPAGTYKYTTLSLACSGLHLRCDGDKTTSLVTTTTTGDATTLGASGTQYSNPIIEFCLFGVQSGVTRTSGATLKIIDTNDAVLNHVYVYGGFTCIDIETSASNYLYYLTIVGGTVSACQNDYVIGQNSTGSNWPQDVFIEQQNATSAGNIGLTVYSVSGLYMTDFDLAGNNVAASFQPASGQQVLTVLGKGVLGDTSTGANFNFPNSGGIVAGVDFEGSSCSTSGGACITMNNSHAEVHWNGGQLINSYLSAVWDITGVVTLKNAMVCNNNTSNTGYAGFKVEANIWNFGAEGNTFGNCGVPYAHGWANNQTISVSVASGSSDNYFIDHNLGGAGGSGTYIDGGTGTHKDVSNNH